MRQYQQQQQQKKQHQRIPVVLPEALPSAPPAPVEPPREEPILFVSRLPHSLEERLVELLNGEREVAERLLSHARQRYPERSEQWIIEKVMYDLSRDRR